MVGGIAGLHEQLPAAMFSITAPAGMKEGDPWFVLAMSALGLTSIVAQPHVMAATASGRTETEARVAQVFRVVRGDAGVGFGVEFGAVNPELQSFVSELASVPPERHAEVLARVLDPEIHIA